MGKIGKDYLCLRCGEKYKICVEVENNKIPHLIYDQVSFIEEVTNKEIEKSNHELDSYKNFTCEYCLQKRNKNNE